MPEWQLTVVRHGDDAEVTLRTLEGIETSLGFAIPEVIEKTGTCDFGDLLRKVGVRDQTRRVKFKTIEAELLRLQRIQIRPEMKDTVIMLDGTSYEMWFESTVDSFYWRVASGNPGAKESEFHPLAKWILRVRKVVEASFKAP